MGSERRDAAAVSPPTAVDPGAPGFFGGIVATAKDVLGLDSDDDVDAGKKKTPPAPVPVPLPVQLVAYEKIVYEDEATGARFELENATAPTLEGAPGFTVKRTDYSPTMKCAAEHRFVWPAILSALAAHEPLEPVEGELAAESADALHAELVTMRDYCMEHVAGTPEARAGFVRLMCAVAAQKYRRTAQGAADAVQKAWTTLYQPSVFRGRKSVSDYDGTAPAPQRPLEPRGLARLAEEAVGAAQWIYQGEGVEQVRRARAATKAEAEAERAAKKAAEEARSRIVRIVPADENVAVIDTNLSPTGRVVATFAWPFPVSRGLTSFDGPVRSTLRPLDEAVEITAGELEQARRIHPRPRSLFVALVADMRKHPHAQDPIPEAELLTQKSGHAMRVAIRAFREDVDRVLPALQLDSDETNWFVASLLQSGVRGRRIHPLSVAHELTGAAKKMGRVARLRCSNMMQLASDAYGAARGGSGAWCPPGFLTDEAAR